MTLWYIARSAGLMAMVALSLSTALGALTSGRRVPSTASAQSRRFLMQRLHLTAAATGLGLLVVHVLTLVLDSASGIGVGAVVIPMASGYRPWAVTAGVLAMYTVVFAALVGSLRGRMAQSAGLARRWRGLHAVAYGGWVLAVAHGVFSGTDATKPWVIALDLVCVWLVIAAIFRRLWSEDRHDDSGLVRSRRLVRTLTAPQQAQRGPS